MLRAFSFASLELKPFLEKVSLTTNWYLFIINFLDPNFEHIGHPEYFLDGLGQLRTTWCGKSWIDHYGDIGLKTRCAASDEYNKQRGKSGHSRARKIIRYFMSLKEF